MSQAGLSSTHGASEPIERDVGPWERALELASTACDTEPRRMALPMHAEA